MPEAQKVVVPALSSDEVIQAANGVAAHAKARFLAGFADEAEALARRAAALVEPLEKGAAMLFRELAAKFAGHKEATPAPPAAPAPDSPPTE